MPEFLGLYPRIRVNLSLVPSGEPAPGADVDAAVQLGGEQRRDLESRGLGTFRQVFCASPLYTQRAGTPACPEDLARHDCILESASEPSASWQFRRGGRDVTAPVHGRLVCDDAEAVLNAALAGSGVARIPSFQIREHVREKRLEVLLEAFEPPPSQTQITFAPQNAALPKVSAFVEFLARCIPARELDL
jgi:DNA-binding transcriptional LysR family regulator